MDFADIACYLPTPKSQYQVMLHSPSTLEERGISMSFFNETKKVSSIQIYLK